MSDECPALYTIDPFQWANLMQSQSLALAQTAPPAMAQASAAHAQWIEKLRKEFAAMDDDALRFRLGEETLAQHAAWNANVGPWLAAADRAPGNRQWDTDRIFITGAIRDEMERRGIYHPNADYTWAVRQRWREREVEDNAERAARISKWLPWRATAPAAASPPPPTSPSP